MTIKEKVMRGARVGTMATMVIGGGYFGLKYADTASHIEQSAQNTAMSRFPNPEPPIPSPRLVELTEDLEALGQKQDAIQRGTSFSGMEDRSTLLRVSSEIQDSRLAEVRAQISAIQNSEEYKTVKAPEDTFDTEMSTAAKDRSQLVENIKSKKNYSRYKGIPLLGLVSAVSGVFGAGLEYVYSDQRKINAALAPKSKPQPTR